MDIKANLRVLALSSLALPFAAACSDGGSGGEIASTEQLVLGDAFKSADPAHFAEARDAFGATEVVSDGLGPIFNERSCAQCHSTSAMGGAGEQIERRYGAVVNGVFNPLPATGGSLRQLFGIGGFNPRPGLNCNSGTDSATPAGATINNVGRLTTPLFGLGLVDSLPDPRFDVLASREPASIRGIVNRVPILLPNTLDPSQRQGATRVGRFGWKAGVSNLGEFSGDAYLNEMGITTTSCINGAVNRVFALENRANRASSNAPEANGCPDDAIPGIDDDLAAETNNCAGGVNELQDDVALFTFFMAQLQPAAALPINAGSAAERGRALFNSANLQCSGCHRSDPDIFVSTSAGGVPAGVTFAPFSDFLVHDMGSLGDGIGNAGDSVAVTRRMRTAPLWGLRFRNKLLHDGRTTDRGAAILAHAGQGAQASSAYNALGSTQKNELLQFLATL